MHSISRVMSNSIKCFYSNCLTKANRGICCAHLPNFPKIEKPSSVTRTETLLPNRNRNLSTHSRCMGTNIKIYNEDNKFIIKMSDGNAELLYSIYDGVMDIKHTRVPSALAGHGVGKILAKVALEYAEENKLIIKISCKFVQHYVNEYEPYYLKYILH